MRKFILFTTAILILNFAQAQKISLLPTATGTGVNTYFAIVQNGLTKKLNTDSLMSRVDSAFVDFAPAGTNTIAFRRKNGILQNLVLNVSGTGVDLTTNQTISGIKTFTGSQLISTNLNATSGASVNYISGANQSIVAGNDNGISGTGSMSIGNTNTTTANYSATIGKTLFTRTDGEIALGLYNTDYTFSNTGNDRVFSVGFGTGTGDRKDLIRANKNGQIILHSTAVLIMVGLIGQNFANDTAAAAGGIVLGGLYHSAGTVRIRIL